MAHYGLLGGKPAMRHWQLMGEADIPGKPHGLQLYRSKDDFHIVLAGGGGELMSTRKHGSEDALGQLPCQLLTSRERARALIGGLGMGFTLAAVLRELGAQAEVTVAELIPDVVEWNRGPLGDFAGRPLDDPRSRVVVEDVAKLLRHQRQAWDLIAMDVDNGPEGLTQADNNWLYGAAGIAAAVQALRPGGVLAYWSAGPDQAFHDRLRRSGLAVEEHTVFAHGKKGARHTIWLGTAY
jgi:spermidine synthase